MYEIDDNWDDSPLENSKGDELGHGMLAKSIANCILSINKTKGGVIAIRGPWGSGKSSVINMVLDKLKEENPENPVTIRFNSWCYRSEDEIVAGFFQELYVGLRSNIDKNKTDLKSLAKLGARIIGVTKIAASGIKTVAPGAGALISFGQEILENAIAQDQSINSLQNDVSDIIGNLNRKVLFVIDDIDRLSPDEAIAIFRVIKSVGRLDNVIYLLSYDRVATENALEKKYPSEGGRYLEKVIQARFDLPEPSASQLNKILISRFSKIFKNSLTDEFSYTDRTVQDIIISETGTPRGVHQLANAISVTFPSVEKNVYIEDFVIIEAIRLFRPNVYQKIQENKSKFFESPKDPDDESSQSQDNRIEDIVLEEESETDRAKLSYLLNHLFPLSTNESRNSDLLNREKRICSKSHFDTYFRFSVSSDAVSHVEFNEFVKRAGDSDFVERKLVKDWNESYNENKIESLFNEIESSADSFDNKDIGPFLESLYSVADRIHTSSRFSDSYRRSQGNRERIIDLSFRLLRLLKNSDEVSRIIFRICDNAPLDLLLELCRRTVRRYHIINRAGKKDINREFMKKGDIDKFVDVVLDKIEVYTNSKSSINFGSLRHFLYCWDTIYNEAQGSHGREKISDTFRSMLRRSPENVIAAAKGFNVSFPNIDSNSARHRIDIRSIDRHINIQDFLIRLFRITKDVSIDEKERIVVRGVFEALNEYDEQYRSRRYPVRR